MASLILVSNSSCVGRARFSKICDTRVSAMSSAATSAPAGSSTSSVTSSAPRSGVHQVWPSKLPSTPTTLLSIPPNTPTPHARPRGPFGRNAEGGALPAAGHRLPLQLLQSRRGVHGAGQADQFAGACVRDGGPDFLLLQRAQT